MTFRFCIHDSSLIARFMGPTWGPLGPCRPQMGPMLALWTLLSGLAPEWSKPQICRSITFWGTPQDSFQGTVSLNILSHKIKFHGKNLFLFFYFLPIITLSVYYICHNNHSVFPHTEVCMDQSVTCWMKAERNHHQIHIMKENWSLKWAHNFETWKKTDTSNVQETQFYEQKKLMRI